MSDNNIYEMSQDKEDFDFTENDYDDDAPSIDTCPKCGADWDEINNEYMHCHHC